MDVPTFSDVEQPVGEEVSVSSENGTPVGEEESYSLANPFLNGMPEEHRTLLAPYVKKWDGQVTKKFQDYSSRLKPYEQLGPHEELQKYTNFVNRFRQDPEDFFRLMWNGMKEQYGPNFKDELVRILQIQQMEEAEMTDDFQGFDQEQNDNVPGDFSVFQQNVMQELNDLREWKQNFEKSQSDAEEQAQLDTVLEQMHTQFGDFNDDFILLELSRHGDVNKAVQAWNAVIGKYSSQPTPQQRQAPKIMGGQGGVPTGQVDTSKLKGADRRAAVANMLAQLEG